MNTPTSLDSVELLSKVQELSELILSKHPRMPTLLREIHTTLRNYPEQVTLLDEQSISVIVSGLQVQTNTVFSQAAISGSGTTSLKKKIAALGTDAF